jgi:formylmethanofuran dehydrogenase subunit E
MLICQEGLMEAARIKVTIRCNVCGEKFVLRGRREKGAIDTGFKQCICNNSNDLDIEEHNGL